MRKFKTFIVFIIVVLFFGLFSVFSATSNVEPNVGISPNEDYYKEENFNRNGSNGSGFNEDDFYENSSNADSDGNETILTNNSMDGVCDVSVDKCINGTYQNFLDNSTHYLWKCNGLNGGSNILCIKAKIKSNHTSNKTGNHKLITISNVTRAGENHNCKSIGCDYLVSGRNLYSNIVVNGYSDNESLLFSTELKLIYDDNDDAYFFRVPRGENLCSNGTENCIIYVTFREPNRNNTIGGSSYRWYIYYFYHSEPKIMNVSQDRRDNYRRFFVIGRDLNDNISVKLYRESNERSLSFYETTLERKSLYIANLGQIKSYTDGYFDVPIKIELCLNNKSRCAVYIEFTHPSSPEEDHINGFNIDVYEPYNITIENVTYNRFTNKISIEIYNTLNSRHRLYERYMLNISLNDKNSLSSIFEPSNGGKLLTEISLTPSLYDKLTNESNTVNYTAVLYGGNFIDRNKNNGLIFKNILASQEGTFSSQEGMMSGCYGYCDIGPVLWMGNGDLSKYDLFFVVEGKTQEEVEDQLDRIFGSGDYSLFKTNPFIGQEDKFNIYYAILSEAYDYSYGSCRWSSGSDEGIERFSNIFNQDWIDGKVYFSQNPKIWGHAKFGEYIKMSYTCSGAPDTIFIHEFGHMFGHLWDEYIYPNNNGSSAINNCLAGEGLIDEEERCEEGCELTGTHRWENISEFDEEVFSGCTSPLLFRDKFQRVMRSSSSVPISEWIDAWGEVNEYYLREKLEEDYS